MILPNFACLFAYCLLFVRKNFGFKRRQHCRRQIVKFDQFSAYIAIWRVAHPLWHWTSVSHVNPEDSWQYPLFKWKISMLRFWAGLAPIWLKSDLYLRYRIESLITPHCWSCSVLHVILSTDLTKFHVSERISEVLTFWSFKSEKTTCPRCHEKVKKIIIFKNTAMRLNYADWSKNHDAKSNYKVYTNLNTIRNWELSSTR